MCLSAFLWFLLINRAPSARRSPHEWQALCRQRTRVTVPPSRAVLAAVKSGMLIHELSGHYFLTVSSRAGTEHFRAGNPSPSLALLKNRRFSSIGRARSSTFKNALAWISIVNLSSLWNIWISVWLRTALQVAEFDNLHDPELWARWSIPSPFAFKMPWKHRGSRQNTLSALLSCDSSSFPCEDPGDCLLSIHQRQWIGWAGTAARKPRWRAGAAPPPRQRLWSWIVQNRSPEPCVPGRSSPSGSAESNAVSAGDCSRLRFPGLSGAFAASAGREHILQPGARAGLQGCGAVAGWSGGMEWICSGRDGVLCCVCCGGVAGQCLLYVLCWTGAAGFGGALRAHFCAW